MGGKVGQVGVKPNKLGGGDAKGRQGGGGGRGEGVGNEFRWRSEEVVGKKGELQSRQR
jgi:hypothetical protein